MAYLQRLTYVTKQNTTAEREISYFQLDFLERGVR
jgi:hypothetical protein